MFEWYIALVLALLDFTKAFEIECNALGIYIRVVLIHNKKLIAQWDNLELPHIWQRVLCISEDIRDMEALPLT